MAAVEKILEELDLKRTPLLRVLNKTDKVDPETAERFCQAFDAICVSALQPETFSPLLRRIEREISQLKSGPPEFVPSYDTPVSSPVAQTV
jgi:GTP-binding protein HflX